MNNPLARPQRKLAELIGVPAQLRELSERIRPTSYVDRGTQILLRLKYRELAAQGCILPFDEVEFRNYSQSGEDGILWYVFSLIGESNKTCVDIGAGNGTQSNCANLIINDGWHGLLIDGSDDNITFAHNYFARHPDTVLFPPKTVNAWVTAENVNELLISSGITGEIDLLSLDVDGVDYWIWRAINAISPRVIIAEIQAIWKCDQAVTVPYDARFKTQYVDGFGVYSGASLPAFVAIGKQKGYRLVGCQRYGFNAVFVRNDVGVDLLPEIPPEDCFRHPFSDWAHDVLLPLVSEREWVKV